MADPQLRTVLKGSVPSADGGVRALTRWTPTCSEAPAYEYFPSLPSNVAQQYDGSVAGLDRIGGIDLRPDLGTPAYARELSFDFVKA